MQKRAGHVLEGVLDVVGQFIMREEEAERWFVSGVVQCMHAREASCRS